MDELCPELAKLCELVNQENQQQISIISRMIVDDFYLELSQIQINEINQQLFEHQAHLFKKLVSYLLNDNTKYAENPEKIAHCLMIYLVSFSNYPSFMTFQLNHLNRLLINILKICHQHPQIFEIWLALPEYTENQSLTIRSLISPSKPPNSNFALYDILIKLFIDYDQYESSQLLPKLLKLTNNSPQLLTWFYEHDQMEDAFTEKLALVLREAVQNRKIPQPVQDSFNKYTQILIEIIEVSAPRLSNKFYEIFETNFLNKMLDRKLHIHCTSFLFSILKTLTDNSGTTFTLERITGNKYFISYINKIIEQKHDNQEFLHVLYSLFLEHDIAILKLMGSPETPLEYPCPIIDLKIKTMKIHQCKTNEVARRLETLVKNSFHSIGMFSFFLTSQVSKLYLHLLLDFFKRPPTENLIVLDLSSQLFLKLNMYNNQQFRSVLEYLYDSYMFYQDLLHQNDQYRFDSIELQRLKESRYVPPSPDLLEELQIDNYESQTEIIDYHHLRSNLQFFQINFLTELYVHSKFKHILVNFEMLPNQNTYLSS